MARVKCYHCGAENNPTDAPGYCNQCGAPLPATQSFGRAEPSDPEDAYSARQQHRSRPLRLDSEEDSFDREYQRPEVSEAEKNARKQAATILFIVAAINLICNMIGLFALQDVAFGGQLDEVQIIILLVVTVGITVVFAGLGAWALFMPLPPSIIGLVLYVLLVLWDIVEAMAAGRLEMAFRGIILKIIIIVALAKAVQASVQAYQERQSDRN